MPDEFDHEPADVPCAGCGKPTAYTPGEDTGTFGQWLGTPIGRTYIKTCRKRACVLAARERLNGKPRPEPKTREQRIREGTG